MSTHRVTKTQPIERFGQRAPTPDRIGSAWSTSCALCSDKVSRHAVHRINTGHSYLNVCATCKTQRSSATKVTST